MDHYAQLVKAFEKHLAWNHAGNPGGDPVLDKIRDEEETLMTAIRASLPKENWMEEAEILRGKAFEEAKQNTPKPKSTVPPTSTTPAN